MVFVCSHCARTYATKYNLKRHLEHKHDLNEDSDHSDCSESGEDENIESGDENASTRDDLDANNDDSDESDTSENGNLTPEDENVRDEFDFDQGDTFTHDEVRAVLRYFCVECLCKTQ